MSYSIGQVAAKIGLSTHTLRYYQKEGLLPFVKKNQSGQRFFTDEDLNWLAMIECLKETGMPLKGIKQYIDWFLEGDLTLKQRLIMFEKQKSHIEEQMALYQKHLQKIEYKIKLYQTAVKLGSLAAALKHKI
ncbi:MAG: MerR family transcriptional regulator [Alphaproteobacteria bacterium]|nr:MerR family transcriptional regulator [Alphaproteobacteria bacterium]MBR1648664.1 MerR family transcriptional regulator [Alphaproteobacteria bacterium]